jgi:hypothetical protein
VQNALVGMALLTADPGAIEVEDWLRQVAAALSDEQRQRNRLVFEALGAALIPEQELPDFPAYLAWLSELPPEQLRERARASLDAAALGEQAAELDPAARALLANPLALQRLLVEHLGDLWERFLAAGWQRRLSNLQGFQWFLQQRTFPTASAGDLIRAMINRELPDWVAAQLGGVRRVVLVMSPVVRLYATRFGSADTLWVFALATPENLAVRSAPIKRIELVRPLQALADESRLHILELLAQSGELPTQDLIAQLDQSQPNVSRHIKQLVSAGFVDELRGEGAAKRYRLSPRQIDRVFWTLRQLLSAENAREAEDDPRAAQPLSLRRFLDAQSRLTIWPAKRDDRELVLRYLASKFEAGREYTEREVNEIINRWHAYSDHATLRRELFDNRLLGRTSDGARYWLMPQEGA